MTPARMLDTFRNNIVAMRGVPAGAAGGGPDYLKITPKAGATGQVRRGGMSVNVPVMQVEAAAAGDPGAFLTWICDYAHNDIKYRTLDSTRPFCFTATMNGCTFGMGTAQPNGVITVSHANAAAVGAASGLSDQAVRQARMAVRNEVVSNFDPHHYEVGAAGGLPLNTTTIGIYDNNEWSFYYQTYAGGGFNYVLRTFRKIDTNNLNA